MKVTQEKLPASQIGLEIEVPAETSKKAYDKVVNNLLRTVRLPGFRPGKVPKQVLMQRFGAKSINGEALQELVDNALKDALKQEEIEAIGNYQLTTPFEELLENFDPNKALTFKAAVDVQPEVTLKNSKGFTLKAEEVKPDPEQLTTTLDGYRTQVATLVPVEDRAVKQGDVAVVTYHGRYTPEGGEEQDVPGGQAENFQMDVEPDRFIPGFVEGVIGMKSGETQELSVQFPDDYSSEELAGCAAKFSMTVHEIKERELPELDDEFAKEISDGEYETIDALREMLEKRFADEAADKTKQNKETAILNELLNHVEVDLPETLLDKEIESMLMQSAYQLQQQGIDVKQLFNQDTLPRLKESSRPEAISRLKRTMALGEIAKQEKLEVSPAELDAKIKETLEELGGQQDVDPERLRAVLSEELLKEKILGWIEENSTIELVPEGSLAAEAAEAEDDSSEATGEETEKKAKKSAAKSKADDEEKPKAKAKAKSEKADKPKAEKAKADKSKTDKSTKAKADSKEEKPKAKKASSKKKS
ncbi:trigger factor [filamentous cyanobacterium LEGE 11480]|uniref:Trigger factor n=1 Tax=Romeriopsis navalis LEGE 11480 TaxID=2777977 RepID=A0A928Z2U4_9CYAN|nr:trigger factor [Romeriopsis navalis]MBE9030766.1 trigger factor [Romeriopsis navalis LEGE 11480]